jgi:hypothetical protein
MCRKMSCCVPPPLLKIIFRTQLAAYLRMWGTNRERSCARGYMPNLNGHGGRLFAKCAGQVVDWSEALILDPMVQISVSTFSPEVGFQGILSPGGKYLVERCMCYVYRSNALTLVLNMIFFGGYNTGFRIWSTAGAGSTMKHTSWYLLQLNLFFHIQRFSV